MITKITPKQIFVSEEVKLGKTNPINFNKPCAVAWFTRVINDKNKTGVISIIRKMLLICKKLAIKGEAKIVNNERIDAILSTTLLNELKMVATSVEDFPDEINFTIDTDVEVGTIPTIYKMEKRLARTP